MQFLKYLWERNLRDKAVRLLAAAVIALVIVLPSAIIWHSLSPLWQALTELACMTALAVGIPVIVALIIWAWFRERWGEYQQYKRWKAGDHSA